MIDSKKLYALALNPWIVLSMLAAGFALGLYQPALARNLGIVGDVYVDLLKMIALPFMVSAVIFSLQRLFRADSPAAQRMERAAAAPVEEKANEAWPSLRLVYCWTAASAALYLPEPWFHEDSGLRSREYWSQLVTIVLTTPVNYVVNKLWTFRAVRGHHPPVPLVAPVVAPELVDEDGTPLEEPQERTGR